MKTNTSAKFIFRSGVAVAAQMRTADIIPPKYQRRSLEEERLLIEEEYSTYREIVADDGVKEK